VSAARADRRLQGALGLVALAGLGASAYLVAESVPMALCGLVAYAALMVGVLLPDASGRHFGLGASALGAALAGWLVVAEAGTRGEAATAALMLVMALALALTVLRELVAR
jgi:hypothetical protein